MEVMHTAVCIVATMLCIDAGACLLKMSRMFEIDGAVRDCLWS